MKLTCVSSCRAIAGVFLLAALAGAEDKTTRRLESVTWVPGEHKLTWVISAGTRDKAGKYKAGKSTTYLIDMSAATMTLNGEGRRFSRDEAKNVHALMDLISKYAVESTIWWDQGQGTPLGKEDKSDTQVNDRAPRRPRPAAPAQRPGSLVKISTFQ